MQRAGVAPLRHARPGAAVPAVLHPSPEAQQSGGTAPHRAAERRLAGAQEVPWAKLGGVTSHGGFSWEHGKWLGKYWREHR